jgi:hypothetical protein
MQQQPGHRQGPAFFILFLIILYPDICSDPATKQEVKSYYIRRYLFFQ